MPTHLRFINLKKSSNRLPHYSAVLLQIKIYSGLVHKIPNWCYCPRPLYAFARLEFLAAFSIHKMDLPTFHRLMDTPLANV